VEVLDVPGMKRLIASFERAITKNQQLRIKFVAEPEKCVHTSLFHTKMHYYRNTFIIVQL